MKRRNEYYTLIASLPPLVRYDRAERLPINPERLQQRLRMLEPEDADVVERATAFLAWERHPAERTDSEMVASYTRLAALIDHPALTAMFEFPINQRTIMVALRRRHRGRPVPAADELWGVGPLVRHIVRNWDHPDFRLASLYPWIPEARAHVEAGEALALERLLMSVNWDWVDRLAQGNEFGFEKVLAYLFKWHILQRWLSYDSEAAKARFEELITGVIDEKERLFEEKTQTRGRA
jgi:hypothetical protein